MEHSFEVSAVFSVDVVARTAHRYSGEYFVRLDAVAHGVRVTLSPRRADLTAPARLEDQFRTDLLDDRLRERIEQQTLEIKTALTRAAFTGAGGSLPT